VRLRARAEGTRLELEVSDDGVGSTPAALARGRARGIGLANVEKRLAAYFGADGRLAIDSRPGEGTTVTVGLPLVVEGASSRAADPRETTVAAAR
jgi:signal transduction histidine kinase